MIKRMKRIVGYNQVETMGRCIVLAGHRVCTKINVNRIRTNSIINRLKPARHVMNLKIMTREMM